MSTWFQQFRQRTFTETYATFDAALVEETARIKRLRRELLGLYEEIDLAIRALDLLGDASDAARERIRTKLTHPETPVPAVFSSDYRQREG